MQSRSINKYIFFGTQLRFLQDAREGWKAHGSGWVIENIDGFLEGLTNLGLQVTLRASYQLQNLREKLMARPQGHALTKEEAEKLSQTVSEIRHTLEAEAQGNIAYIVTDKRLDVRKLTTNIGSLMSPEVFDALPDVARYDFAEAGKCIAFERPTAAAFHLLRGTESVLRRFYCSIVKRGRAAMLWGPMVDSLRKRRSAPPGEILDNLDSIRRLYRNPTAHPEKKYDIQEVQDLFGLCVDAVNRMVKAPGWQPIRKTATDTFDEVLKKFLAEEPGTVEEKEAEPLVPSDTK